MLFAQKSDLLQRELNDEVSQLFWISVRYYDIDDFCTANQIFRKLLL